MSIPIIFVFGYPINEKEGIVTLNVTLKHANINEWHRIVNLSKQNIIVTFNLVIKTFDSPL